MRSWRWPHDAASARVIRTPAPNRLERQVIHSAVAKAAPPTFALPLSRFHLRASTFALRATMDKPRYGGQAALRRASRTPKLPNSRPRRSHIGSVAPRRTGGKMRVWRWPNDGASARVLASALSGAERFKLLLTLSAETHEAAARAGSAAACRGEAVERFSRESRGPTRGTRSRPRTCYPAHKANSFTTHHEP
jgi:hypothetical protein